MVSPGRSVRRSRSATAIEQLVAGGVAGAVVDGLEVVEVHEQDGDGRGDAVGARQGVVEAVGEQGAVGQAGQGVVEGVVLELRLQLLLRGDVAGGDDDGPDVGVGEQVGVDALHVPLACRRGAAAAGGDGVGRGRR